MWKTVKLGDVCELIGGGTPSKKNAAYYGGDIPWATVRDMHSDELSKTEHRITELGLENSSSKVIPANNIVIASRVGLGKVCLLNQSTAINQDLRGVIPKQPSTINVRYLFYWFKNTAQTIISAGRGATVHGVTLPFLKALEIPLPPLAEQQRIVAKLDAAFAEIDRAVEVANERHINTTSLIAAAQNSLFENMSSSISRLKLSEVAKFENGDRGKNYPSKKYQISEGIPFVNAGDFSLNGDIKIDGMAYISEERFDLLGAGKFEKDDVLFCLRGSLGKSAINKTLKRGAIASSLVIIRALQERVHADYLFAFMRSDIVKKYISETAGGAAQPNLSAKVVMGYKIPVPSSEEQEFIAEKFWALRQRGLDAISLIEEKKSELVALKSAILAQELQPPQSEAA